MFLVYRPRARPYTQHPTPCTLHPKLDTQHPTPFSQHPTLHTPNPKLSTSHPKPVTLNRFLRIAVTVCFERCLAGLETPAPADYTQVRDSSENAFNLHDLD